MKKNIIFIASGLLLLLLFFIGASIWATHYFAQNIEKELEGARGCRTSFERCYNECTDYMREQCVHTCLSNRYLCEERTLGWEAPTPG
ncbi:hypothetical protein GF342_00255 [Candidatus Woesearchaeota archaeon]|nr:hypothetical protein [Candidatus Woesearchaeota archaeon]